MSDKKVYVQNLRRYPSTFPINVIGKAKGDRGEDVEVLRVAKEIKFEIKRTDPNTGVLSSTGYTPIEETDYDKIFEQSAIFRGFVKSGEYVRFDDPPVDAFMTGDIVDSLQEKLDVATARITELEGQLAAGSSKTDKTKLQELGEANKQLARSVTDLTAAKEVAEEAQRTSAAELATALEKIETLTTELAEAKGETL